MNNKSLVLASFVADSLALGAHWIYDTDKIDAAFGTIHSLQHPLPDSYHQNRKKGHFTHYGDQTLQLLRSIVEHDGFSLDDFARDWQNSLRTYDGYLDKATKETLAHLAEGRPPQSCGSASADLGGAVRIAPLVYRYQHHPDQLLTAVREQTAFTHNNPTVLIGAEVLARITLKILAGIRPMEAVEEVLDEGVNDLDLDLKIRAGLDSAGEDTRKTIKDFGQTCAIAAAMPGVIHLIATYENDLETALVENVMAGGDSAARGLAAGMILGAHLGIKAIPLEWLGDMRAYDTIMELLDDERPADDEES
jgi:ADP-ribosylglycohydrolase